MYYTHDVRVLFGFRCFTIRITIPFCRLTTMAASSADTGDGVPGAKRKRVLDTCDDAAAGASGNTVRDYLVRGAKLWVVTRHMFYAHCGVATLQHDDFVFADKTMAEAGRDIMIEDLMVRYIDLKYDSNDVCASTDKKECRCQSCGDAELLLLHEDPVSYAEINFDECMEYNEPQIDHTEESYIRMDEWKPPVVLSSLPSNITLSYAADITKTHAYKKYYPAAATVSRTPSAAFTSGTTPPCTEK